MLLRLVAVLALVLAACGSDDPEAAPADAGPVAPGPDLAEVEFVDETGVDAVRVDAADNAFRPAYVEVTVGTTVTFRNIGRNEHNALPVVDGEMPEVTVEDLGPGDEASVTFDEVGDVAYYCSLHGTTTRGMVGGVRVVE